VALIPGFHDRYTESIQARLGYMAIMAVIVGTSYVIEKQIIALKEQVL